MAGGGGGDPGVLETPTYICAAVFAIFLLLSLFIDKVIHGIEHKLGAMKRKRLKTAFHHIIQELMLMGLMSLLLIVVQDSIAGTCVKRHNSNSVWVILHHVDHCHPCLEKTKAISDTYKDEQHCPFWENNHYVHLSKTKKGGKSKKKTHEESSGHKNYSTDNDMNHKIENVTLSPSGNVHEENTDNGGGHRRKLLAGSSGGECKEGYVPLVSVTVLHEIHIFIFLLGVTHVATSVLMIVLASGSTFRSAHKSRGSDRHTDLVAKHLHESLALNDVEGAPLPEELTLESQKNGEAGACKRGKLEDWTARNRDKSKFRNVILEYIISFFKQFIKPISTEELDLMRASFMLTHKRVTNFDFLDYITAGLDDDFIKVVTINLNRGLTVALFILLLAPIKWGTWQTSVVMVFIFLLPMIVTTKLVYIVRHVTRGGRVHKLDASVFWFGKPKLLLPVINFMLFMCSLAFALLIFFAWQFGEFSCLFYGNSSRVHITGADWTWIVVLLASIGSYVHLSLVTLPTYSLVVHMGDIHWHKDLVPQQIQGKLLDLARRAKKGSTNRTALERKSTELPSIPLPAGSSIDSSRTLPHSGTTS